MVSNCYFNCLVLFLSWISIELVYAQTPSRCTELGLETSVCHNCREIIDCASPHNITSCAGEGQICYDIDQQQALCAVFPYELIPDEVQGCYCSNVSCSPDPYNEQYVVGCNGDNQQLEVTESHIDCGDAAAYFNDDPNYCKCQAIDCAHCPGCSFVAAESGDCIKKFYHCGGGSCSSDPLYCQDTFCFKTDGISCGCVGSVKCTDCGEQYGPDPDGDNSSFYFCGGLDLVKLTCAAEDIYTTEPYCGCSKSLA